MIHHVVMFEILFGNLALVMATSEDHKKLEKALQTAGLIHLLQQFLQEKVSFLIIPGMAVLKTGIK